MKKQKKWIAAAGICALTVLGGNMISAYFTDQEAQDNIITVGRVAINLFEPKWNGEEEDGPDVEENPTDPELGVNEGKDIYPLKEIPKDPQIKNIGINSSWVYMEVKVPKAEIITANEDGTRNEKKLTQLFTYEVNENWEEITPAAVQEANKTSGDYNTYVYAYKKALKGSKELVEGKTGIYNGEKSEALFEKIVFVNAIEGQGLEESELKIPITAMAIQSEHTGTYKEAYEKYMNQSQNTTESGAKTNTSTKDAGADTQSTTESGEKTDTGTEGTTENAQDTTKNS